jgi:hypothetical protein
MSFLSEIGGSIVTAVTGVDSQQLQAQLTVAEQTISTIVQVIVVLMVIQCLELALLVRYQRK